jgi:hypothetical protein
MATGTPSSVTWRRRSPSTPEPPARGQRRRQEEGARGSVQERRPGGPTGRDTRAAQRPRLPPTRNSVKRLPTASMTCPRAPAGSASGPTTTRPRSPSRPCAPGGTECGQQGAVQPAALAVGHAVPGRPKKDLVALQAGDAGHRRPRDIAGRTRRQMATEERSPTSSWSTRCSRRSKPSSRPSPSPAAPRCLRSTAPERIQY